MGKKIKKDDNFLELVPKKTGKYKWETNEDGFVKIIIPRNGVLDKIVRFFFKTPKEMKIDLDEQGSIVWKLIDGKNNIENIGSSLKDELGKKAEPVYERLGTYINILRNNDFITLEKVSD
ncbi:PqqD family protein [Tepidibacter hydrothermalis]|uniref:PqqD family protein n=1 Tax=Tepidibacter hydrothermalis TaxID=3036126 RepID=A0ABY8EDF9_9FIRM|nr:PqqD family protein [Tepidibacter hydrothermalis]WFD10973.1 PqqD family protein [Tepidibacter hydrothermalis]